MRERTGDAFGQKEVVDALCVDGHEGLSPASRTPAAAPAQRHRRTPTVTASAPSVAAPWKGTHMRPLTDAQIRASFVNASRSERKNLTLPTDLADIDWDRLDFLGLRDPKLARIAHVVADIDDEAVGVLLRQTDARPLSRPQCSWCNDIELPNDVVMFAAKRAGDAGRRGDTVGILVCENFECSHNVRRLPPSAYLGFDREAARDRRIDALRTTVTEFVRDVRGLS